MRKLSSVVISLPVMFASFAIYSAQPGFAETQNVGPTGAVRLLAQSRSVDARCKHLTSREHGELNDYVAKAEIGAAKMSSAAEAQDARRSGNALGKKMACGRNSEELVRATLDAARRAMRVATRNAKKRVAKQRQVTRQPQRAKQPVVAVSASSSLTGYRSVTEAYYLERRCQHLSRPAAVRFWHSIVARHKAVLRKYSKSQVAKAKSGAKHAADSRGSCGQRTASIVQAGLRRASVN